MKSGIEKWRLQLVEYELEFQTELLIDDSDVSSSDKSIEKWGL